MVANHIVIVAIHVVDVCCCPLLAMYMLPAIHIVNVAGHIVHVAIHTVNVAVHTGCTVMMQLKIMVATDQLPYV